MRSFELTPSRSAASALLRIRVSGVFRSCATLSVTSFNPTIRRSIRSSISFRDVARRSNSSLRRVTGTRSDILPEMIFSVVLEIVSMRLRTRIAVIPPVIKDRTTMPITPSKKPLKMMAV